MITLKGAVISAKNVYQKVTLGEDLRDGDPGASKVYNKLVTVGGKLRPSRRPKTVWNFNGGKREGVPLSDSFRWKDFETLAKTLLPGKYDNKYTVAVFTKGGTYDIHDFLSKDAEGDDKGHSLVVFNTQEDVQLDKTRQHPKGRQFGASVLAPFSKVTLKNQAGYVDGVVIAKEFISLDSSLQMHGYCYKGPLKCN